MATNPGTLNYTDLVASVTDICENTFQTSDMNWMIEQAEQKIYNTVQLPVLRKNVMGALVAGNQYLTAPADYLSTFSLAVIDALGNYTYLLNKDANFIREAYPSPLATGQPVHYAIFGPNSTTSTSISYILGPTPDQNYAAELHYYYYPESIVTAGTTWLGNNFSSALLNGVLLEAIRFMKGEPDLVKMYQDMYDKSMILLKELGDGKNRQDMYRSGQVRVQVI